VTRDDVGVAQPTTAIGRAIPASIDSHSPMLPHYSLLLEPRAEVDAEYCRLSIESRGYAASFGNSHTCLILSLRTTALRQ